MKERSLESVMRQRVVLGVLLLLYIVWALMFIERSVIVTSAGRYFCLFDDAMVSLRYAWNLAHGDGLVWNPGERVEGITSFLFTLYMSLGAVWLSKSGAALFVQITGLLLVLGVAVLAHRIARLLEMSAWSALIIVAAVLAYYPLSYWSLMGMETGLLAALALSALHIALQLGSEPRAGKLLGLLLGLMFATRPDAAVPAAWILLFRGAWILRHHRRAAALRGWSLELAVFAGIIVALTLFRCAYYGSPVPNTYQLKMAEWPLGWRLRNGWRFVRPFLGATRYLLLLASCSLAFHRDGRRLSLLGFAASVLACQIWVGGDAWPLWRMLVPAVLASIILAVDGAVSLVRWMVGPERRSLLLLGLSCPVGALLAAERPFLDELWLKTPAYMMTLNRSTVQAALELSRYADPLGSVAVAAAGAVPYYSGLRGVDVLGKSDPHIARLKGDGQYGDTVTPGHNKYDLHYSIEQPRPDSIYDAVSLSRRPGNDVFGFVKQNYVQRGSFWLRRGSPHIHWDRVPAD